MSVDAAGKIYIAANRTIRKVTPAGVTTSLRTQADPADNAVYIYSPAAIGFDGSVYGFDRNNRTIFKSDANGVRTIVAGGRGEVVDGTGTAAVFSSPGRMAVDSTGNVYLLDRDYTELTSVGMGSHYTNHLNGWESVRKITPDGVVSTFAGYTGYTRGSNFCNQCRGMRAPHTNHQAKKNPSISAGVFLL